MLAKWESNPHASTHRFRSCNVFSEELSVITVIGYVTMVAGPGRLGPAHRDQTADGKKKGAAPASGLACAVLERYAPLVMKCLQLLVA
jgi:hypothetical protein